MTLKPDPAVVKQRIKQTAKRISHIKKVLPALVNLNKRRRKQLATSTKPTPAPSPRQPLNIFGVDYAWGNVPYEELRNVGTKYALRYISHDFAKDLDTIELRKLRWVGIKVGLVFESTASRALSGYDAGRVDAEFAKARCHALGLDDIPVFFGVDFDATPAQRRIVMRYLDGAVSVLGYDRVGVYGSYYVVRDAVNFKTCKWFWQTYAWSGGLVHDAAHVYQYSNGHSIGGLSCDYNHARTLAWAR